VEQYREPLGLDRWQIRIVAGEQVDPDATASCDAQPEYRSATLSFDLAKMKTGDDLEEFVVHEMVHCLTWPIHTCAETLAGKDPRLQEWVRFAAETTTTDCAESILRLMRRARNNVT
jgi:hypothetical protein